MGRVTATLRYRDGSGALYNSAEEALAQARHDLAYPTHLDPLEILEGDATADLGRQMQLATERPWFGAARVVERSFQPCECRVCEFQREAPTLHHEDRAILDEMLAARVILERDLTPDERQELERLIGSTRSMAQRMRDRRTPPPIAGGSVPGAGFTVPWTALALTAATAKTLVGGVTSTNTPVDLAEVSVGGDATSGNILIQLVYGTNATAGTSTPFTPSQMRGRAQTLAATAATNFTAEPTVLTVLKYWRYPWPGGPHLLQSPLGREMNSVMAAATAGKFFGIRVVSTVAVSNCDGYAEIEE